MDNNRSYLFPGACGLLKQFLSLKIRSQQARQAELEVPDGSLTASIQSLINSFLICWFITGNFVYKNLWSLVVNDIFCTNRVLLGVPCVRAKL